MWLAEQLRKKVITYLVLILIIVAFESYTAKAVSQPDYYAKLSISSGQCFDDGSFEISVENLKNYRISTESIQVVATQGTSNITPPGSWFFIGDKGDEVPLEKVYGSDNRFKSPIGVLNETGSYTVKLRYKECESFPDFCESKFVLQNCPGYRYNCGILNLKINKCYNRENQGYVILSGLNNEQYSKINPIDDIVYNIKTKTRVWLANNNLEGMTYNDIGNDTYLVKFPLENLTSNKLELVEARVSECPSKSSYISNCKEPKCITDGDCLADEFCDSASKICKPLDCSNCQAISEHRCVEKCKAADFCQQASCSQGTCSYNRIENCCKSDSECSDSLICTTNACVNNTCVNKNVECQASSDPCIIGKCEEPVGCKYSPNPDCEKASSLELQANDNFLSLISLLQKGAAQLSEGDTLPLLAFGKNTSIVTEAVGKDFAEISVGGKRFKINLAKDTKIDLNNDGIPDIGVTLNSVDEGKANLTFAPVDSNRSSKSLFSLIIPAIGVILAVTFISLYGLTKKTANKKLEATHPQAQATSELAIEINNFSSKHGNSLILDKVSFIIKRGEMVCLLGPSGVGKSTIIEALVGRKSANAGAVKIFGKSIKENKIYDFMGFVPQAPELYLNQSVEQNLVNSSVKWHIKDAKPKIEKIASIVGLADKKDVKANKLSGGQQKLLSLAMELIRDVDICILDEPTSGLDPNTRNSIVTILSTISHQLGKTVFFTTHFMDDAEECDNVIILANKTLAVQGTPSKLKKSLPGEGRVVNIILDNVTDSLLKSITAIPEVKKVITEGRNIKLITDTPNAIKLGQKIEELGGTVNEASIEKASMMEVFVFYTGVSSKENV